MGFGCPGMMQSGPAGSRKHSRASPYPIGSGCCNSNVHNCVSQACTAEQGFAELKEALKEDKL